jgi:hypothetical protein
MKMTYETKAGFVSGSITTVVPSALVHLLKIEKGDKLVWDADIKEKGITITITPVTKSSKEGSEE